MDLLLEECSAERRLYCYIDPEDLGKPDPCHLCDEHCFDDGSSTGGWNRCLCESNECRELHAWYDAPTKEGGYKRRDMFKRHFGKNLGQMDRSLRREAILTAMLLWETKGYVGRQKLSLAA